MLKGINRQVVEIAHPESAYFEKVLFFVKPEYSSVNEEKLKSKAQVLIKNASAPPFGKNASNKKDKIIQAAKFIGAAFTGAAAVGILSWLF